MMMRRRRSFERKVGLRVLAAEFSCVAVAHGTIMAQSVCQCHCHSVTQCQRHGASVTVASQLAVLSNQRKPFRFGAWYACVQLLCPVIS